MNSILGEKENSHGPCREPFQTWLLMKGLRGAQWGRTLHIQNQSFQGMANPQTLALPEGFLRSDRESTGPMGTPLSPAQ